LEQVLLQVLLEVDMLWGVTAVILFLMQLQLQVVVVVAIIIVELALQVAAEVEEEEVQAITQVVAVVVQALPEEMQRCHQHLAVNTVPELLVKVILAVEVAAIFTLRAKAAAV
jgi:hypothetical protein